MYPIETRRLKALLILIGVYVLLSLLLGGIFAALWSWPEWTGFVAMALVSLAIWWFFIADDYA